MTRAELIKLLSEKGIDKVYGRSLSRCLKSELEDYWLRLTEAETILGRHFSFSQITTFLRCNLQFYWRYLEGRKVPPSGAMVQGKNLHRTVEYAYILKFEKGEVPPDDELFDYFHEGFKEEIQEAQLKEDEKPDELEKEGMSLIKIHREDFIKRNDPIDVEKEFKIPFEKNGEKFFLIGFIDLETEKSIADNKFTGRKPNEKNYKLQLATYKIAVPKPTEIHAVVKTKKPYSVILPVEVTEEDSKRVWWILDKVIDSIRAGIFNPSIPYEHWWCSPDWCGYWSICMGKAGQK